MARFVAAQPPGYLRKAVLIAVAAIVMAIAWAAVAFSQTKANTFIYADGVLKPDGSVEQRTSGGHVIIYTHTPARKSMAPTPVVTTVLRDGKPWLTLTTAKDGTIAIGDPNGSGQPVVTIPSGHPSLTTKPETR